MEVKAFFDQRTATVSYVLSSDGEAAVIDPIVDYDPTSGRSWADSVGRVSDYLALKGLELRYVVETHPHANHLSGASLLQIDYPTAEIVISSRIREIQSLWSSTLALPDAVLLRATRHHHLAGHGETLPLGTEGLEIFHTPGHSPADLCLRTDQCIFTGATLLEPDVGCGRTDLPGGSADALYDSVLGQIYALPPQTQVFAGHDYPHGGRGPKWLSTIDEQRRGNIELSVGTTRRDFVAIKQRANEALNPPKVLFGAFETEEPGRPGDRHCVPVGAFPRVSVGPLELRTPPF